MAKLITESLKYDSEVHILKRTSIFLGLLSVVLKIRICVCLHIQPVNIIHSILHLYLLYRISVLAWRQHRIFILLKIEGIINMKL